MRRTILAVDLVEYSNYTHILAAAGPGAVYEFNRRIADLIHASLAGCAGELVVESTGDGALVCMEAAADADRVAASLHAGAAQWNAECREGQAGAVAIWFRAGAATGEVDVRPPAEGRSRLAGHTIVRAVRLQARARPGAVLVDTQTHTGFPPSLAAEYGPPVRVYGKRLEWFTARERVFTPGGPVPRSGRSRTALALVVIASTLAIPAAAQFRIWASPNSTVPPTAIASPTPVHPKHRLVIQTLTLPVEVFVDGLPVGSLSEPGHTVDTEVIEGPHLVTAKSALGSWSQSIRIEKAHLLRIPASGFQASSGG